MISIERAIEIILENTLPLSIETVDIESAVGRVLAEDIAADTDLPPFNRAQMDGYAIRSADTENLPARLRIVGESAAGKGWHNELNPGEAVRIMTGAPVPTGADSVQKVEVTSESGNQVEILESTIPGQFIVTLASEISSGQIVIQKGTRLTTEMIAPLAAFGHPNPAVFARPRVSVLPTGSELVRVDQKPGADQIRDSNGFTLKAYAELAGATVKRFPVVRDNPENLKHEIALAADSSDLIVLSGGVSMGIYDFTKSALRELGAEIFFERVALRPGKPTVFARLGRALIFGLPGNPVSVSVTFNLFARTALLALQGMNDPTLQEWQAIVSRDIKGSADRTSYLPATISTSSKGELMAEPLKWGGSSDFVAFTRAEVLIIIPSGTDLVRSGSPVRIVRLPSK